MNSGPYPSCIYSVWVTSLYQMDFRPKKRKKKTQPSEFWRGYTSLLWWFYIGAFIYLFIIIIIIKEG
jgi:hypothetical protein